MTKGTFGALRQLALLSVVVGASTTAGATVIFFEGHQQVGDGIHLDGATGVSVLTGHVHPGGPGVEFKNALNSGGNPALLHGSNGVAKIEACSPCSPANQYAHATFRTIEMWVQAGWGFTDMDWALTPFQRQGGGTDHSIGNVTFTAYDQFGGTSSASFLLDTSGGKDKWHFHTLHGQLVTRLVISSGDTDLHHLEQMSANYAPIQPIPAPGSLALATAALALLAPLRRRSA